MDQVIKSFRGFMLFRADFKIVLNPAKCLFNSSFHTNARGHGIQNPTEQLITEMKWNDAKEIPAYSAMLCLCFKSRKKSEKKKGKAEIFFLFYLP